MAMRCKTCQHWEANFLGDDAIVQYLDPGHLAVAHCAIIRADSVAIVRGQSPEATLDLKAALATTEKFCCNQFNNIPQQ